MRWASLTPIGNSMHRMELPNKARCNPNEMSIKCPRESRQRKDEHKMKSIETVTKQTSESSELRQVIDEHPLSENKLNLRRKR